ncbi:hypothetical protein GOODEAATRI_014931 [Goodea atripinnis]|uniref:Uncharacterized protein n=1 Tax=Goodea atripinnis TaxID=208336 RepID=A0ABV0MI00_9TELE
MGWGVLFCFAMEKAPVSPGLSLASHPKRILNCRIDVIQVLVDLTFYKLCYCKPDHASVVADMSVFISGWQNQLSAFTAHSHISGLSYLDRFMYINSRKML